MNLTSVWIVIATYGPESDVEPMVAAAASKEWAEQKMELMLAEDGVDGEAWIVANAEEVKLYIPADVLAADPPWRTMLSETQQETLFLLENEEVRDSAKEIALEQLDNMSAQDIQDYVMGECESLAEELGEGWVAIDPSIEAGLPFVYNEATGERQDFDDVEADDTSGDEDGDD